MGGGVESPQGNDTPGVAELTWGKKKPGVTTTGEGKTREGGQGQGEDKPPPTTQATGVQGAGGGDNERMGGPRMAAPLRPQWGTKAGDGSVGTPKRHTTGINGTRPKHGALACRKYGLLAPMKIVADPADVRDPRRADKHESIEEQAGQDGREPEEGNENWQQTFPAHNM